MPTLLRPLLLGILLGVTTAHAASRRSGPWDLEVLGTPPAVRWGERQGMLQPLWYAGEPLKGQPTEVYAVLGRPTHAPLEYLPAVVLVHGGGGKAFPEWASHWARRGYVALAMDLAGQGPDGKLPNGMPDQADTTKFREFSDDEVPEMWTYHAVAAVIRGHSLVRSLPEVDGRRVGLTGISWGGYLTCIAAGVDPRFRAAVPVYGCGFLGDNSHWVSNSLAALTPASRARWLKWFDPSRYLARVRSPILFLNGTTDFAYPLDSYQKSYRLVPETHRYLSVVVDLPHGHIWSFPEVDVFLDGALQGDPSYPKLGATQVAGGIVSATVRSPLPLREASLCFTQDRGPWQQRRWQMTPAQVKGTTVSAPVPPEGASVMFLAVTDERGVRASSEHVEPKP